MSITTDMKKTDTFLRDHRSTDSKNHSITRIPDAAKTISGISCDLNDEQFCQFLQLYLESNIKKNIPGTYTERQFEDGGPLAVDIDLRFSLEVKQRLYTEKHVEGILGAYLDVLASVFQFDQRTQFRVYYLSKIEARPSVKDNCTKDGMHFLFCLNTTAKESIYIRERVLNEIPDIFSDIPITNTPESILDEGIATKKTNWQLIGSGKPGNICYQLSKIYIISGSSDGSLEWTEHPPSELPLNSVQNLLELSVRNKHRPTFPHQPAYIEYIEECDRIANETAIAVQRQTNPTTNMPILAGQADRAVGSVTARQLAFLLTSRDILDTYMKMQLELWEEENRFVMIDAYHYTMALPDSYYGPGSFVKWLNVGWALKGTNEQLFIVWIYFSAQSPVFNYTDIPSMYERWYDAKSENGFTYGSIKFWLKNENWDEYIRISNQSINTHIERLLRGGGAVDPCGDVDIALLLHKMYGDSHICVSTESNIWYVYINNHWVLDEKGSKLRVKLDDIHSKYLAYSQNLKLQQCAKTDPNEVKSFQTTIDAVNKCCRELNQNRKRNAIMNECKEKFLNTNFLEYLDNKPELFCFENGVVDLEKKVFRPGSPYDYLSITCGWNYHSDLADYTKNKIIIDEIELFLRQIYPEPETYEYMWDHMASMLYGRATIQAFHLYWGDGGNGKSKFIELLELTFGQYTCKVPLSMITEKRASIGSVSPEVVALKGKRLGVMAEPNKNTFIEEGPFKELTSGVDKLSGRGLWMKHPIEFTPQVTLIISTNHDLKFRTQDQGVWRRNRKIPHISTFSDKPDYTKPHQFLVDTAIGKKFEYWAETMLALLVKRAFMTDGNVPLRKPIEDATTKMRANQDIIAEFINDCIERCPPTEKGGITKIQLKHEYSTWLENTYGNRRVDMKSVQEDFTRWFGEFNPKSGTWEGVRIIQPVLKTMEEASVISVITSENSHIA